MKLPKITRHHPAFIVIVSTILSVLFYLLGHKLVGWIHFWEGLILASVIPLLIAIPIALFTYNTLKKLKQQKVRLEQLDNVNKKLFALISHDVRSPLINLKGLLDIFLNEDADIKESKEYLGQVADKLDGVTVFLDGLLDWSKRQTLDKPLEKQVFSCATAIKPVCKLLEPLADEKNIKILANISAHDIYADENSYAFIFRNVLHNAIKFTPENGKIYLRTYQMYGKVYTEITDTGVGISEREIEKIMEGENWFTTKGTSNEKGTGFGIRTCLFYLKKNKGTLNINSTPGQGTTMTFELPQGRA
ncbi:sensor histidine kinase [Croceivirga sp. JEA036]|uniref:sensor histidine kinase n=1 Tax=Croceivirga sp. JEA036 TaxID=2721162 RepID=UPI00143C5189|nr:HAMP domain-containing sensor histidine kinase [Croceivirga sp. JEA036]NJB36638.1 HAMP domain-containing histidine kinase [Croceivirga sp. JEA036]